MAIKEHVLSVRARPKLERSRLPRLENGDHLTRAEFELRYQAMPQIKKAELVEGVVYMPSPVSASHSQAHAQIMGWLAAYCAATPYLELHDNATVRLDSDNEVQPDALVRLSAGGRSRVGADGYLEGAPELIVEVAASSAAIDLHVKRNVYRRNGVQEYIVWQIHEERLSWFELHTEDYREIAPNESGVLPSHVFPGLWLAADGLLAGDLAKVLAELQRGLASEEHRQFLERLAQTKDQRGNE